MLATAVALPSLPDNLIDPSSCGKESDTYVEVTHLSVPPPPTAYFSSFRQSSLELTAESADSGLD